MVWASCPAGMPEAEKQALPRSYLNGATLAECETLEFLERLVPLVPRPDCI